MVKNEHDITVTLIDGLRNNHLTCHELNGESSNELLIIYRKTTTTTTGSSILLVIIVYNNIVVLCHMGRFKKVTFKNREHHRDILLTQNNCSQYLATSVFHYFSFLQHFCCSICVLAFQFCTLFRVMGGKERNYVMLFMYQIISLKL